MEERRKYIRLDVNVEINYTISPASEPVLVSTTKDISVSGIRFFPKDKLEVGTQLDMEIKIPGTDKPLKVSGEVIWSEEFSILSGRSSQPTYESGVKFVIADDAARECISRYIFGKLKRW